MGLPVWSISSGRVVIEESSSHKGEQGHQYVEVFERLEGVEWDSSEIHKGLITMED